MLHVISWSGGKDSTASVILLHEHYWEIVKKGDKVLILFSEVMFDLKNNISGHNPDIIKFIKETAIPVFKSWGFDVEILHSDKDYLDVFYHKLKRSPDPSRVGMTYGFCLSGKCAVKRDCKIKPINEWKKRHENEEQISYVGIAIDEPDRLVSLHKDPNAVSLLEKYGLTEADARKLCADYGLLSPQYSFNDGRQNRDGCWFCPNAKLCEHEAIRNAMPEVWQQYVALENTPNLSLPQWNPYSKESLHDRDEFLRMGYRQMSLFEFIK